jgi:hypothetical protein
MLNRRGACECSMSWPAVALGLLLLLLAIAPVEATLPYCKGAANTLGRTLGWAGVLMAVQRAVGEEVNALEVSSQVCTILGDVTHAFPHG